MDFNRHHYGSRELHRAVIGTVELASEPCRIFLITQFILTINPVILITFFCLVIQKPGVKSRSDGPVRRDAGRRDA